MRKKMGGACNSTRALLPLLLNIISIIFLVAGFRTADAQNKLEHLRYTSLSPFWQWRGAYECLLNSRSSVCADKDVLKLSGWIQVNETEIGEYCKQGGCADYIRNITLTCVHAFKRDFWFSNKATVSQIRALIDHGCSTNTEITTIKLSPGS